MSCVFCGIVSGQQPASVVDDSERTLAFMDIYPARPGHLLVIPKQHAERLSELDADTVQHLFARGVTLAAALRASRLPCDDVNFLLNDGRHASQTVPHVHLHVIPRVRGDLPRLLGQLALRPVVPLLGAAPRERLEEQAAEIARALR